MTINEMLDELSVLHERFKNGMGWHDGNYEEALYKAIEILEQAEQIVRCKECKYDGTWKCKWRNVMIPSFPSADDFCSYGEREGE